ncbi:MAG: PDZ domain-containing protein, partial [Rhodobacterales bacterium]|nr:PDZ domain-containing protein [Rhodobacterales bacterium]
LLRLDVGDDPLPVLDLADSDTAQVGDLVLAIGNPFGVGQTVTSGIISANARTKLSGSEVDVFLQTDAAINPGNSGGALLSMDGRVVGINTAIYSKSGGSMGIGFAIPSNLVKAYVAGVEAGHGGLVRPWLGAWGQGVTSDIAASLGMDRPAGILINDIYKGGPADRAGLKVGDVVRAVNGQEVDEPASLRYRVSTLAIGGEAKLNVWRRGRETSLDVALRPPPEDPPRDVTELSGRNPLAGATVANMSPAFAEEVGLDTMERGVIVVEVRRGSSADRVGFEPGDFVRGVNGRDVKTVADLRQALQSGAARWGLAIQRGDKVHNLVIDR